MQMQTCIREWVNGYLSSQDFCMSVYHDIELLIIIEAVGCPHMYLHTPKLNASFLKAI